MILSLGLLAIAYANPSVPPPKVVIPPGWLEHQTANPKPSMAYTWTNLILEATGRDVVRVGSPKPTIISRQMAIPLTAMYDAWAAYDEKAVGTRLGGKLRRPLAERTEANKAKAISYATYRALLEIMPADREWLALEMKKLGYDPADLSTDPTTPAGIGNLAAAAVLDYRRHDGSNQYGDEVGSDGKPYSDYTYYEPRNPIDHTNDPDRWQQIPFDDGKGGKIWPGFLTPHWYRVKPFALERGDQFRPGPQPKVGSPQLKQEVEQVVAFNGGLSLEQKSIVEFMREGPRSTGQSGHWLLFAQDISRRDHYGLDQDVKLFFAVGNTALDAFIASWEAKRFYDSARPYALVRSVQQLFAGQNIIGYLGPGKGFGTIPASKWHPYSPGAFVTPPFPGYVSGHSTVSGACAKTIELFTGSDKFGVYHRHIAGMFTEPDAAVEKMQSVDGKEPKGLPANKEVILLMPTLSGTADLAGLSRIMGGYHIQADNLEGLKLGRAVAESSWPKYRAYFEGTATVRQ
ncbi:MAG TPA: vanadium-dependent haloperoxidase [Myxococcales bacterium]|nr:vanadium-dependent haloperoxidase [Myxococcales bacterium]